MFFGHYFSTRNFRKPLKGSKDSDFSLVSNKYLSEILPFSGWVQGHTTWGRMTKNLPHLLRYSQKKTKLKIFFITGTKTCCIFWGFEQLSSATGSGIMQLPSGSLQVALNTLRAGVRYIRTSILT